MESRLKGLIGEGLKGMEKGENSSREREMGC